MAHHLFVTMITLHTAATVAVRGHVATARTWLTGDGVRVRTRWHESKIALTLFHSLLTATIFIRHALPLCQIARTLVQHFGNARRPSWTFG